MSLPIIVNQFNKIIKILWGFNTPPTVNYGLLQTILSSGELTIIKILTDEIDDPILRVRVTREVAKTINSINSEVSNLYSQEVEGYSNPVNVIYDEV